MKRPRKLNALCDFVGSWEPFLDCELNEYRIDDQNFVIFNEGMRNYRSEWEQTFPKTPVLMESEVREFLRYPHFRKDLLKKVLLSRMK